MKTILALFIVLIMWGCNAKKDTNAQDLVNNMIEKLSRENQKEKRSIHIDNLPTKGDIIGLKLQLFQSPELLLINGVNYLPYVTVEHQGIIYEVAWDENKRINYIATSDTNFVTNDNIRVRTPLSEIQNLGDYPINMIPGWAHYIILDDGWNAAFCVDSLCTGRELVASDEVAWVYK